ncbi:MAG: hypothetical protein LBQ34_02935 [Alphaproteobacteria bacterium]|jgi:hypothetical protein|nr:hypothetical protein [Alphaproteobacteria bacterium]
MKQDLNFLENTEFGDWIKLQSTTKQEVLGNWLSQYNLSIVSLEEPFKSLILRAYGFTGMNVLIADTQLFFKALRGLPKVESFIDLLKSIFGDVDIVLSEETDGISINIIVRGNNLFAYYVDKDINFYVDIEGNNYVGYKQGDYSNLGWFFLHFLKRFITAGIKIKALNITLDSATNYGLNIKGKAKKRKVMDIIKNFNKTIKELLNGN